VELVNGGSDFEKHTGDLSESLSALFGYSVLTGKFEYIFETLELMGDVERRVERADEIFKRGRENFKHYLKQMEEVVSKAKGYHYL